MSPGIYTLVLCHERPIRFQLLNISKGYTQESFLVTTDCYLDRWVCIANIICFVIQKKKKNSKEFRIMRLVLSWLTIIIILIKVVIIWEKTYLKLFSTRSCINSDYFEKLKADIRFKSIHFFTSFIYFVRIHEENTIFNLRLWQFW